MSTDKFAVMGSKDAVLIFKALGMDVYFTDNINPQTVLYDLVSQQYPVILVTERDAHSIAGTIDKFASVPYPIILPIPDGISNLGRGNEILTANIEKARGVHENK